MDNVSEGSKAVVLELAKYDYVFEYNDSTWSVGGRVKVQNSYCEELVKLGFIELDHGNSSYTAWKLSKIGHNYLFTL